MKVPILRGGGGSSRELYTLQHLVTQNRGFIAGGYARWALSPLHDPARPSDIDCYFRDLDGMQAFSYALGRSGWHVTGNSAFAVRFTRAYFDLPVHAVCVVGTPGYILSSMDLGICQAVLDHCEGRATYSFEDEERAKVLKIVKPHNLELTIKRIMKYQSRGYTIDDEEMDKLFDLFAVHPLTPGETPFANYQILGRETLREHARNMGMEESAPTLGDILASPPPLIDWLNAAPRPRPMSPAEYNARQNGEAVPTPRPEGSMFTEEEIAAMRPGSIIQTRSATIVGPAPRQRRPRPEPIEWETMIFEPDRNPETGVEVEQPPEVDRTALLRARARRMVTEDDLADARMQRAEERAEREPTREEEE